MSGFSDYTENAVLDHTFGGATFTKPAATYVALYTAAPSDAGGGTEVSGNGYARQTATWNAASGGSKSNNTAITFPAATPSGWGIVTHFAVFDSLTGGNMLAWAALSPTRDVTVSDSLLFSSGSLVITLN